MSSLMLPIHLNVRKSILSLLLGENGIADLEEVEKGDRRAVGGRLCIEIFDGLERRGAGQVVDDDVRLAGNVFRHVAGEQPGVDVVTAPGRIADDKIDRFALVEISRGLRPRLIGYDEDAAQDEERCEFGSAASEQNHANVLTA